MNSSEKIKVLKERAKALSAPHAEESPLHEGIEVVEFMLAKERYGLETRHISEVYTLRDLTELPCTPAFVMGVINVRGRIVSVIDMKKLFGLPQKELSDLNKVLIINDGKMEFGVLADEISGTRLISLAELQPSLPTLTDIRAEYLRGITPDRITVLDAGKILSDKKIIVHEEV